LKLYVGRGVGRILERKLKEARKEIVVVSPWIGKDFSLMIKNFKGKKLVVTREDGAQSFSEKLPNPIIIFLSTFAALLLEKFIISAIIFVLGIFVSLLLPFRRLPPYVKVVPNLHAKIYIFDGKTFLSSSNLTPSASKNIEFILELESTPPEIKKFIEKIEE